MRAHVDHLLSEYIDQSLSSEQVTIVEQHLASCDTCQSTLHQIRELLSDVQTLPKHIAPPEDVWQTIALQIDIPANHRTPSPDRVAIPRSSFFSNRYLIRAGIAFSIVLLLVVAVQLRRHNSWQIARLTGTPLLEGSALTSEHTLQKGQLIETDAASTARLKVGPIGEVDVHENTRLQVQQTTPRNHRILLDYGQLHAKIWAPPRQFFVETPAGLAIDLGCEYTLEVDSAGNSLLHVLSGHVGFAWGSREVIAPAGWKINARPNHYPGTPFSEFASPEFQQALLAYDFTAKQPATLQLLLQLATPEDALTLWELLWRTRGNEQVAVYERLTTLVQPPTAVTRQGVLNRNKDMITAWRRALGVDVKYWLDTKKKKMRAAQQEREDR